MTNINIAARKPPRDGAPLRILCFAAGDNTRIRDLHGEGYEIEQPDNAKDLAETLRGQSYDLVLLDDSLFGDTIYLVLVEVKRGNLSLPIVVLTDNQSAIYQTNLVEAGADDVLSKTSTQDHLRRRLNICLKRNERTNQFIQANANLHRLMRLMQQLNADTEPQPLIEEVIQLASESFMIYGIAVVIPENGILRIFSGSNQSPRSILQTLRDPESNEPLNRCIRTGLIELFEDISRDQHYIPLSNLPQACGAITVPIQYQGDTLGAIAVFGDLDRQLDADDALIFEILANHFASALQNAYLHQSRQVDTELSQTLLKAWQKLVRLERVEDVAETLRTLVETVANVDQAVVWLNPSDRAPVTVYTGPRQERVKAILRELLTQDGFENLVMNTVHEPQTVSRLGLSQSNPLQPLFRAMHARQLVFLPLEDSARLIAGILISVASDRRFGLADANLVKNLSLAAGQALERIMLLETITDKSERLEAILRSITEGIFFVDDTGSIAYCNPQVTELTEVNPSEILEKQPEVLLDLIAEQATDPEKARGDLHNAFERLTTKTKSERTYPIVALTLRNTGHQLFVEFVALDDFYASRRSWVGFIRLNAQPRSKWDAPPEAIILLLRVLYRTTLELRSAMDHVTIGNGRRSKVNGERDLDEIKEGISNAKRLLEQFTQLYNLEVGQPDWTSETINLHELLLDVIQTYFREMSPAIVVESEASAFCIEADRQLVHTGMFRLLANTLTRVNANHTIRIWMSDREDRVQVHVELPHMSAGLQTNYSTLHDLTDESDPYDAWEDISLFYTLIQFQRCQVWVEDGTDHNQTLIVSFPKLQVPRSRAVQSINGALSEASAAVPRAPLREPEALMLIYGTSAITKRLASDLEHEGYVLLVYSSSEEALGDIDLTHLDLIVLDGKLPDEDSVEVCRRIQRRTEVPIVFLGDSATKLERVEALKAGAEDYITEPISKEELLAKINVLLKRQHLVDRTEPPLDFGDLHIDFARRVVFVKNEPIILTRIEYDLLRTLAVNMGQVLTHKQLLEKVWGPEHRSETQYLWVHLSRLRKKLEPTDFIHNRPGIGYIFQTA